MKLAISNIAWTPNNNTQVYELLKRYNFDGIELAPTLWIPKSPYDHLDQAIQEAQLLNQTFQLKIYSMQSICYGRIENIFNSNEEYSTLLDYMKSAIDFAYSINCSNLVFGCPKNRIINNKNDISKAYTFFKEIGLYAETKNITISIEPNPIIYGTNFLNTTNEALNFVKSINLPFIRLNLDLGTVLHNKESLSFIESDYVWIGHVHISEPYLEILKQNEIHLELMRLLKKVNYDKCVSIEMKTQTLEVLEDTLKYIMEVFHASNK